MGYSPWGRKELDAIEQLNTAQNSLFIRFFSIKAIAEYSVEFLCSTIGPCWLSVLYICYLVAESCPTLFQPLGL